MMPKEMQGFDGYMAKLLQEWNAPGVGVGIVEGEELVFAQGYGFRDYGKRLPFTPTTLFQIASNTKLFTAVAAGLLVEEGKLTWDKPVRDSVPAIRFHDDGLNNAVTLRDMLAHRTGITRHDSMWFKSDFSRGELFERLKHLEPREPLRQTFLYNNMMYMAVGQLIELQSGRSWEEFVRERILQPLGMSRTVYTVAEMVKLDDHAVPFTEKRDSTEIHEIPYYEDIAGIAPAGAIVSGIQDVSHWLAALMNQGKYGGKQVLPPDVLAATLEPAIAQPNVEGETWGFWERLNSAYGMGRSTSSYRGHLLTDHGGALDGFHSQVSFMPQERIGVIVFSIGNHCAALPNIVGFNVYERMLGMDHTPWSERWLEIVRKDKKAGTEARAKAGAIRVRGTHPSHSLADYAADYEHPAYGTLKITEKEGQLQFQFHKIRLPLTHYHYDRFDTPDDERLGMWSMSFHTDPQGDVDRATMSLDEAEATFTRKPRTLEPDLLARLAGTYKTPSGFPLRVVIKNDGFLYLVIAGQPENRMLPYRGLAFRIKQHSDVVFEFFVEGSQATAFKQVDPSGEYLFPRADP